MAVYTAIKKSEIYDSNKVFPLMWEQCLKQACEIGFKYISFNGMIFETTCEVPEYKNALCLVSDL